MTLTNIKKNKRPNELTSTMLVGLSAIKARTDHDLTALGQMETIAGNDIPTQTAEKRKDLDTNLQTTLDKMRSKNSLMFQRLGNLEKKVTELAQRNDKLVRKQPEVDRLQGERVKQGRLIAEIEQKMERVRLLKENREFDASRLTSRSQLTHSRNWNGPMSEERQADLLAILFKLKESVVMLVNQTAETERQSDEVRRLDRSDHIYK